MPKYFFDIRDRTGLYPDDEGLELQHELAARSEAVHALADIARDAVQSDRSQDVVIEVRTKDGPVFHAAYVLTIMPAKR